MNRVIAVTGVLLVAACGPQSSTEASAPKALHHEGDRNDALFAAAEATNVPAEVLMLAAWRQTRFELVEREELLPAEPPADGEALTDEPMLGDETADAPAAVDFDDDLSIPAPMEGEAESLGVEPDEAPRFGLFARATEPVRLSDDTLAVAKELQAAALRRGLVTRELSLQAWSPVLAEVLVPDADSATGAVVARELENAWLDGFDVTTSDGERVAMLGAGRDVAVAEQPLKAGRYPAITVIPASRSNYGSRDGAKVRFIVIHDIEGTQAGAIAVFKNPARKASAHYIVRASDGRIVKMVNESAAAWHAGHSWFNHRSIGIEHEGFADRVRGGGFYTDRQYTASAQLVCAIAKKYRIPIDRKHIFGHGNVPSNLSSTTLCSDSAANAARCGGFGHHHDPGRFWAWASYMTKVRRCIAAAK